MATAKKAASKPTKVAIKLTPEQKQKLEETFGKEIAKRIVSIKLDKIEGFLTSNVHVN